MTLIATGQGLRRRANQAFAANARLEAREIAAAEGLDAARQAQAANLYGTAAGIGASYGISQLGKGSASAAGSGSLLTPQSITPEAISQIGIAPPPELGSTIAEPGLTLGGTSAGSTGAAGGVTTNAATNAAIAADAGGTIGSVGAVGAETAGTIAAPVVEAAAGAEAVAAGSTAAGGSSTLATIGALAGPIAIGLGAAFLINKLFD